MARRHQVNVFVAPRYRRALPTGQIRAWAETALARLELLDTTGVDITVTDDAPVHELNRAYRGLDEPTDVLSFPYTDRAAPGKHQGALPPASTPEAFVLPEGEAASLGEIVIAFPYAQRHAVEKGCPAAHEVALLVVHGVLHLIGYDHEEPEERALMWARTAELLDALRIHGVPLE